jgi:probable rRNA maturation factor
MGSGDSGSNPDRPAPPLRRPRRLHVAVVDGEGRPVRAGGLGAWLEKLAPRRASGSVSIGLVGDARVRRLNRTYRGKDCVTDVLSFPFDPSSRAAHLGDIVIAAGVARRQARSAGHSPYTELRILALHGLLHLIGYDHETDNGAMKRLERRLRRMGGLPAGLIERAAPASPRQVTARVATRAIAGKGSRRTVRQRKTASGAARAQGPRVATRAIPGEGPRSNK